MAARTATAPISNQMRRGRRGIEGTAAAAAVVVARRLQCLEPRPRRPDCHDDPVPTHRDRCGRHKPNRACHARDDARALRPTAAATGTLNSTPIQVPDRVLRQPRGRPVRVRGGRRYLGFIEVTTNDAGNASFDAPIAASCPARRTSQPRPRNGRIPATRRSFQRRRRRAAADRQRWRPVQHPRRGSLTLDASGSSPRMAAHSTTPGTSTATASLATQPGPPDADWSQLQASASRMGPANTMCRCASPKAAVPPIRRP